MNEILVTKSIDKLLEEEIKRENPLLEYLALSVEFIKIIDICKLKIQQKPPKTTKSKCIDMICNIALHCSQPGCLVPLCQFLINFPSETINYYQLDLIKLSLLSLLSLEHEKTSKFDPDGFKKLIKSTDTQNLHESPYYAIIMACFATKYNHYYETIFNEIIHLLSNVNEFEILKLFALNILIDPCNSKLLSKDSIQRYINLLNIKSRIYSESMRTDMSNPENKDTILVILDLILNNMLSFKEIKVFHYLFDCYNQIQVVFDLNQQDEDIIKRIIPIMMKTPLDTSGSFKVGSQISFFFGFLTSTALEKFVDDTEEDFRVKFLKDRLIDESDVYTAELNVNRYKNDNIKAIFKIVSNTLLSNRYAIVSDIFIDANKVERLPKESSKDYTKRKEEYKNYIINSFRDFFSNCTDKQSLSHVFPQFINFCIKGERADELKKTIPFLLSMQDTIASELYKFYPDIDSHEIKTEFNKLILNFKQDVQFPAANNIIIADLMSQYMSSSTFDEKMLPLRVLYRITGLEQPQSYVDLQDIIMNQKIVISIADFDKYIDSLVRKKSPMGFIDSAALCKTSQKSKAFDRSLSIIQEIKNEELLEANLSLFMSALSSIDITSCCALANTVASYICKQRGMKYLNISKVLINGIVSIIDENITIDSKDVNSFQNAIIKLMKYYTPPTFIRENYNQFVKLLELDIEIDKELSILFAEYPNLSKYYKRIIETCTNKDDILYPLIQSFASENILFNSDVENFISYILQIKSSIGLLNTFCSVYNCYEDENALLTLTYLLKSMTNVEKAQKRDAMKTSFILISKYIIFCQRKHNKDIAEFVFDRNIRDTLIAFLNEMSESPVEDNENVLMLIANSLTKSDISAVFKIINETENEDSRFILTFTMLLYDSYDEEQLINVFEVKLPQSEEYLSIIFNQFNIFINKSVDKNLFALMQSRNNDSLHSILISFISCSNDNIISFIKFVCVHKSISSTRMVTLIKDVVDTIKIFSRAGRGHLYFIIAVLSSRCGEEISFLVDVLDEISFESIFEDYLKFCDVLEHDVVSKLHEYVLENANKFDYINVEIFNHTLKMIQSLQQDTPEVIMQALWSFSDSLIPDEIKRFLFSRISAQNVGQLYKLNRSLLHDILYRFGQSQDICLALLQIDQDFTLHLVLDRINSQDSYGGIPIDQFFILAASGHGSARRALYHETNTNNMEDLSKHLLHKFSNLDNIVNTLAISKEVDIIVYLIQDVSTINQLSKSTLYNAAVALSESSHYRNYVFDLLSQAVA